MSRSVVPNEIVLPERNGESYKPLILAVKAAAIEGFLSLVTCSDPRQLDTDAVITLQVDTLAITFECGPTIQAIITQRYEVLVREDTKSYIIMAVSAGSKHLMSRAKPYMRRAIYEHGVWKFLEDIEPSWQVYILKLAYPDGIPLSAEEEKQAARKAGGWSSYLIYWDIADSG